MPIATKVVCFSRLLKCLRSLYGKQCGPRSGSTLFASILYLSLMWSNYLQQTTSADDIFRCIFFLALYGLKFFIWGGKVSDIWSEIQFSTTCQQSRKIWFLSLYLMICSPTLNENCKYGYPHSYALLWFYLKLEHCNLHKAACHPTKCDVINDIKLFLIHSLKFLTLSNQTLLSTHNCQTVWESRTCWSIVYINSLQVN